MKFFTSILTISLLTITSIAQIPSFFKTGARWDYIIYESQASNQIFHEGIYQHTIIDDTLFENIRYKILSTTLKRVNNMYMNPITTYQCNLLTLIRHDTLLNKVFHRNFNDSIETLLYDFNMVVGDTILLKRLPSSFDEMPGGPIIVDSVFKIYLFGDSVKIFVVTDPTEPSVEKSFIVEGFGSYKGLLWHNQNYFISGDKYISTVFSCFENNSIKFYFYPIITGNIVIDVLPISTPSCEYIGCLVGIDNQSLYSDLILFPNPTTGLLHLQIQNAHKKIQSIILYDITGKAQEAEHLPSFQGGVSEGRGGFDEITFNIHHLPQGIYFCNITLTNGQIITKKFIKQQ